ncbi:unnamed protein product [Auanema sp. JU1783]|nr:unnamed protein product [Auanema sp. JU1783]
MQIINNFETVPARTVRDEVPAQTVEDREWEGRKNLSLTLLSSSTSNHECSSPLLQYGQTSEGKGLEQTHKQIILEIHQKLLEIIKNMQTGRNGGGSETEQKEDSVQTVPDDISKQREAGLAEEILDQVRESYPCIETRGSVQGAQTVQNDVPEGMEEVRAQRIEDKILDYYKNKTSLRIVEKEKLDVSRVARMEITGVDKDLMEVLEACDSTYLRTNITALINRVNKMPYDGNTKTFITHSDWRGQLEMKFVCIVIHKYMIGSLEASDYIICTYHYIRIVPAVPDSLVFLSGLYPRLREMALPDTTISSEQKKLIKRHFLNKLVKSGYLKIENKRLYIK